MRARGGRCALGALALSLALLSSCSSWLRVKTEIYTGAPSLGAMENRELDIILRKMMTACSGLEDAVLKDAEQAYANVWTEVRKVAPKLASSPRSVGEEFAAIVRTKLFDERYRAEIKTLEAKLTKASEDRDLDGARAAQLEMVKMISRLRRDLNEIIDQNKKAIPGMPEVSGLDADTREKITQALDQTTAFDEIESIAKPYATANKAGESLDHIYADFYLSKIVEDEEGWAENPANRASAFTFFGNAEIAFQMENRGKEVHVKGVTLDPRRAFQATFTVMEQAVTVAATAYGVPLATGGGGREGEQMPAADLASKGGITRELTQIRTERLHRLRAKGDSFRELLDFYEEIEGSTETDPIPDGRTQVAEKLLEFAERIRKGR